MSTNKLRISSPTEYTIEVNDKGETISIDFSDVAQVKAYNEVILGLSDLQKKMGEVAEKMAGGEDTEEAVKRTSQLLDYLSEGYKLIDKMFGKGASEKIFNGKKTITGFYDFFTQIVPHMEKAMHKVRETTDEITKKYEVESESKDKILK